MFRDYMRSRLGLDQSDQFNQSGGSSSIPAPTPWVRPPPDQNSPGAIPNSPTESPWMAPSPWNNVAANTTANVSQNQNGYLPTESPIYPPSLKQGNQGATIPIENPGSPQLMPKGGGSPVDTWSDPHQTPNQTRAQDATIPVGHPYSPNTMQSKLRYKQFNPYSF